MDSSRLGQRFGHFVRMIFQAEGFQVDVQPKDQRGVVPDLLVRSRTGVTAIVVTEWSSEIPVEED